MKIKILVCEDDNRLNGQIVKMLNQNGYDAVSCRTFSELEDKAVLNVDLFLLDVHLSDGNILDCLQWIHEISDSPVLLLSADCEEDSILRGYTLDVDEYIEKPVRPNVLLAKIRASLKRRGLLNRKIEKGEWSYDLESGCLEGPGRISICLSASGKNIFRRLFLNSPKPVNKEVLKSAVSTECTDGSLRVRITELRKMLPNSIKIRNRRESGYSLEIDDWCCSENQDEK